MAVSNNCRQENNNVMIIEYYAHPASEKRIVRRDLSAEKILYWEIEPASRLGYEGGNLSISFDTSHLARVVNEGDIYPPISDILNYDDVMRYLRKNFSHLEIKSGTALPATAQDEQPVYMAKKFFNFLSRKK